MHFRPFFLLLSSVFLCYGAIANPTRDGDDDEVIVVLEETSPDFPSPPKSPSVIPIGCVYSSSIASIVVYYLQDLGSVTVEIENQTTGEYSQSVVNALAGPMLLPISGTVGQWQITFTLSSGTVYYGVFIII